VPQTTDDRCPGVLRLHAAEDGRLARVRLPGGMLGARQLGALAGAARLGNDIVELTSRAGVQIRGLAPAALPAPPFPAALPAPPFPAAFPAPPFPAPALAAAALAAPALPAADRASDPVADPTSAELERILATGGLLPSATHDRVRNILASPLAGRDMYAVAPTDALVTELDRLICADPALAGLPGRFAFDVDDGSRIGRSAAADVTLRALDARVPGRPVFRLLLAGVATDLTARPTAAAAELAVAAARAFVELRRESADPAWHVGDLPGAVAEIARRLGGGVEAPASPPAADQPTIRRRTSPVGIAEQRDGLHAVSALARLGRLDAAQLDALAELCRTPAGVRLSTWKTVTLLDVPAEESRAIARRLTCLGLVVSPGSPWVGLSACAGSGACAKSRLDVRLLAATRAAAGRPAETEHWSGCERRCGQPAHAAVAVAPTDRGLAVRVDGVDHHVATPADALDLLGSAAGPETPSSTIAEPAAR
jgi:sulfite reductase beta subunit-like hemoprotein